MTTSYERQNIISRNKQIRLTLALLRRVGKTIGHNFGYADAMRQHYRLKCGEDTWHALKSDIRILPLIASGRVTFDRTKRQWYYKDYCGTRRIAHGDEPCIRIWPKPTDEVGESASPIRTLSDDDLNNWPAKL